jgi:hypothetical protein
VGLSREMYSEIDPPALMVSVGCDGKGGGRGGWCGKGVGGWGWCVQGAERGLFWGGGGWCRNGGGGLVLDGAVA